MGKGICSGMGHEPEPASIWIEAESWPPASWSPADANTDVVVTMKDGSRWVASFFSYGNVNTLAQKNKSTGENLAGAYLWARDMILVAEVERGVIEEVIRDLLREGEFTTAFRHVSS